MTIYEGYSTTDFTNAYIVYNPDYVQSQTFTIGVSGPNEDFYVKSGSLRLFKSGSPSNIWVYIQKTNNGHPNEYLCSGQIDESEITTNLDGAWVEVSFSTNPTLSRNTKYALTVFCTGDSSNYLGWKYKDSDGYSGGNREFSSDGGNSWSSYTEDFYFNIFGSKARTIPTTLRIYYSSLSSPHYIECPCVRWDTSDYSITIETILDKTDRNTLFTHITPGAVSELYNILGKPFYVDKTFEGNNTIRLAPISGTSLYEIRSEKIIYVKNYSETDIDPNWLHIKIEGYISGGV